MSLIEHIYIQLNFVYFFFIVNIILALLLTNLFFQHTCVTHLVRFSLLKKGRQNFKKFTLFIIQYIYYTLRTYLSNHKKPHYHFYSESSIMGEWKPLISLVARHNWMTSSNFSFPMALTRESLNITFCSAHFTKSCFKFQSIQDHAHLNHHAWREWNPWLVSVHILNSFLK